MPTYTTINELKDALTIIDPQTCQTFHDTNELTVYDEAGVLLFAVYITPEDVCVALGLPSAEGL